MICKVCKKDKTRIWNGLIRQRPKQIMRVYVHDCGKRWQGHVCSSCCSAKEYLRRNLKKRPNQAPKIRDLLGPEQGDEPMTLRLCRHCSKKLPPTHYFYHSHCGPKVDFYDIGEAYGITI